MLIKKRNLMEKKIDLCEYFDSNIEKIERYSMQFKLSQLGITISNKVHPFFSISKNLF